MENERLIEKINYIANSLESLRQEIIREDKGKPKKADVKDKNNIDIIYKGTEEELKKLALKYDLPISNTFIEDVLKIVKNNSLTMEQIENTFSNIKRANEKSPKEDIAKYTYSCLYRINSN